MKKKPYSSPALKNLTLEQAKKIVAQRKNRTEEEAAQFLESLQRQQNDQKRNEQVNDKKEQERKRSA
jgi:NAD(P)H-nitrite reductase large subunit